MKSLLLFFILTASPAWAIDETSFIIQAKKLLSNCETMQPSAFAKSLERLNIDFIKVMGVKGKRKDFLKLNQETRDLASGLFPHSLPSGRYESAAEKTVISYRDVFGVCASDELDLLDAMKELPKGLKNTQNLRKNFSRCVAESFTEALQSRDQLVACFEKLVP